MTWKIEFDERARKELRKLDQQSQDRILKWIRNNLATNEDPRENRPFIKRAIERVMALSDRKL
ncbi:MAG: hypothetical protein WD491_04765 [Balneolales bacterium]